MRIFTKSHEILLFLLLSSLPINLLGSIKDYIYPFSSPSYSNYGTLGLIQMPSARMQPEGSLAFSWSDNNPYQRGSLIAYPFDWAEISYQYTDINNALYSDSPLFSGNQSWFQ